MATQANPEIDDQVCEIIDDMLADRWGPALYTEKAERWGVSISCVWRRASEASRFIRISLAVSSDDIRDELLRNIRRIGGKAEDAGDYRNALSAQELRLRVHGLLERKRDDEGTEQFPLEQIAAALRTHGYDVKGPNEREHDTERPGKERVEGFISGEDPEE